MTSRSAKWLLVVAAALAFSMLRSDRLQPVAARSPAGMPSATVSTSFRTPPPGRSATGSARESAAVSSVPTPAAQSVAADQMAPTPAPALDPWAPQPAVVIENMRIALRHYSARFGGNPVGTNPEITQALLGGNPGHATFVTPEDGLRVNARGEMVDPWGTPFFFHQLSSNEMEIRSAGPDGKMWTQDDIVVR